MAFLFQGPNPLVMHITSFLDSANLDLKGKVQLNRARIIMAIDKVLRLSNYLIRGLAFPLVSHNQSYRRLSLPPSAYALLGVLRSLSLSACKVNLGGVKRCEGHRFI